MANKEAMEDAILQKLSKKLGRGLTQKVGKGKLVDIVKEIAGYKEQMSWSNTDSELRRLQESVRYLEPRIMVNLKLSKKSEASVSEALRAALKSIFPFLQHRN